MNFSFVLVASTGAVVVLNCSLYSVFDYANNISNSQLVRYFTNNGIFTIIGGSGFRIKKTKVL